MDEGFSKYNFNSLSEFLIYDSLIYKRDLFPRIKFVQIKIIYDLKKRLTYIKNNQ